jgi:hypothetical protein
MFRKPVWHGLICLPSTVRRMVKSRTLEFDLARVARINRPGGQGQMGGGFF